MMKVLKKKRKGGFTLIELIVVIAILGILAAIAIPRLAGFTGNAAQRTVLADVKVIESAVVAYQSNNPTTAFSAIKIGDLAAFLDGDIITKYAVLVAGSFDASGKIANNFDITVNGTAFTFNATNRTVAPKVVTP